MRLNWTTEALMSPMLLLSMVLAVMLGAALAGRWQRHRRRQALRRLAREWEMRYVAEDVFQLGARLGELPPLQTAVDLVVRDLMYAPRQQRCYYLFTVEFTQATGAGPSRLRCAAGLCECSSGSFPAADTPPLHLADPGLPLLEQYRRVKTHTCDQD